MFLRIVYSYSSRKIAFGSLLHTCRIDRKSFDYADLSLCFVRLNSTCSLIAPVGVYLYVVYS